MMIKKLINKHKYPPEGIDDVIQIVMSCGLKTTIWMSV
ncbi:DUF3387 domain-containing protein [Butyrivibrio sp. FC2001]|nr:DUF3387 domain-containing protein [Butyrivibrio sp. FC2001]